MGISRRFPILALQFFLFLTVSITVTAFFNGESLTLPLPNHVLHQFPNYTWVENLAVRSNGDILVTLLSSPDLYLIDPSQPGNAVLLHSFPSVSGLRGIAELDHDVFYVAAGNMSLATGVIVPASSSIWEVDMRSFCHASRALVRKVTDIPEAVFLNGATALSYCILLIADSVLGLVWRVNVLTGSYSIAISDPFLASVPTGTVRSAVNGIKLRDSYLYFTNSNQGSFGRFPISTSGNATGAGEILVTGLTLDDFALDSEGRAWIAENPSNVISLLLKNGTVVDAVGAIDQLTVAGATACAFGRDRGDPMSISDVLYCCTAGGLAAPVNGTVVEGGKVVVIDMEQFKSIATHRLL